MNYYFTFGLEGQIYKGGWVTIIAENPSEAIEKFIDRYGDDAFSASGLLRYSMSYAEEEFLRTGMDITGNFDRFCHETIK